MAAAVLVSGPALRPLLQLVDQTDGAAGEELEAHGDDGKAAQTRCCRSRGSLTVLFLSLRRVLKSVSLIYYTNPSVAKLHVFL